jgi:hypothetical protein
LMISNVIVLQIHFLFHLQVVSLTSNSVNHSHFFDHYYWKFIMFTKWLKLIWFSRLPFFIIWIQFPDIAKLSYGYSVNSLIIQNLEINIF